MKGYIISIEGTDGSGKHTQQQLLSEDLKTKGYKTFNQSFPNYDSPSANPVKMYLDGAFGNDPSCLDAYEASALYAVDRLCTYKQSVEKHYLNGEIILFDRYVQSNFIHQSSKINDDTEKQKYLEWIQDLEFEKFKLPRPDLVFFIEMPTYKSIELAHARAEYKNGEKKDILEEDTTYLEKSYKHGLNLAKQFGWTLIHCLDSDGNLKTREAIHDEIMQEVEKHLKEINL